MRSRLGLLPTAQPTRVAYETLSRAGLTSIRAAHTSPSICAVASGWTGRTYGSIRCALGCA